MKTKRKEVSMDVWLKSASPFLIRSKKIQTTYNPTPKISRKERLRLYKQNKHKKRLSKKEKKWRAKLERFNKKK